MPLLHGERILPFMSPQEASQIKQRRRARVRTIRGRVIGGSVALFLAVWSLIAVVLITGHDPGLAAETGHKSSTASAATTTTTTTSSTGTGSNASTTSGTAGSSSSGASTTTGSSGSTGSVSPVTSGQS